MNAPDGRRIFVWRGKDPVEDNARRLTEAVAEAGIAELFEADGALVWHREGQTSGIGRNVMREIVTKFIVTVRLVKNRGSGGTGAEEVEYYPFGFPVGADTSVEPDQQVLMILVNDLKAIVAKGPSTPQPLSPQLRAAVLARLKVGEPAPRIAEAYRIGIDAVELIRRLAR